MKNKVQAEKQAKKVLNYYSDIANKLSDRADKLALKDRPKQVQARINRINKIDSLTRQAEQVRSRGLRVWAYYINNYSNFNNETLVNPVFKL